MHVDARFNTTDPLVHLTPQLPPTPLFSIARATRTTNQPTSQYLPPFFPICLFVYLFLFLFLFFVCFFFFFSNLRDSTLPLPLLPIPIPLPTFPSFPSHPIPAPLCHLPSLLPSPQLSSPIPSPISLPSPSSPLFAPATQPNPTQPNPANLDFLGTGAPARTDGRVRNAEPRTTNRAQKELASPFAPSKPHLFSSFLSSFLSFSIPPHLHPHIRRRYPGGLGPGAIGLGWPSQATGGLRGGQGEGGERGRGGVKGAWAWVWGKRLGLQIKQVWNSLPNTAPSPFHLSPFLFTFTFTFSPPSPRLVFRLSSFIIVAISSLPYHPFHTILAEKQTGLDWISWGWVG